jgi:PAS domain S-box-containing protein
VLPLDAVAPAKPPHLLVRFAIYAGLALALAAGVGAWIAQHTATSRAERDVFADAKFTADQLGADDLAHLALRKPVSPALRDQLDELFGRKALGRGVVRVTLFSRAGRITYSTDHSLIGVVPYDLRQVREAMRGETAHGIARLRGGFRANPTVITSYVPLYWYFDKNSSPNGVLGVYRDYAPVRAEIRDDVLTRTATIVLALLLLYLASFPILRAVTRRLAEDNRLLVAQAEALRKSEEQYRLIVETAAEGVCLLDAEGRIVFTNQKLAEMLGRPTDELVGEPLVGFMDELSRAAADPRWFRTRDDRAQREFTLRRRGGGPVYTSMSANPIFDQDGRYTGALAMATDISDRKRAEEALEELEDRLRHSPEAAAASQAASIAADFNNAVTAITGYSDYLLGNLEEGDPLRREAEEIRRAADGAAGLTRQLLAFSRRESLHPRLVDLDLLLQRAKGRLATMLGEDVDLVVTASPGVGLVETDEAQIEQVVVNLVLNARDQVPEGGIVTVTLENADLDAEFARSHVPLRAGHYVLLSVHDTGPGLDDEARARLFKPVSGASGAGQHGLATVYGIVKQSDGYVWVASAPGSGTTFSVYLPRADEPDSAA